MSRGFLFCASLAVALAYSDADARNFRGALLPTAPASCNTCHTTGGGTPRNSFGLAVESRVTPGGREVFWGPGLAGLDSDGDGFTNGQELGDPDGDGVVDPLAKATLPGIASSFPQSVAIAGAGNRAVAVVNVTNNGLPLAGATVSLSRSISGLASDFAYKATTSANGVAVVNIEVTGRSASGYYRVQVADATGAVIATKGSVPLNGAYSTAVSVAIGAPASKVASLGNSPNPFNPTTQIRYQLSGAGLVKLTVYNSLGQEVTRLVNAQQGIGAHSVTWDAKDVASGLYFYELKVDGVSEIGKMLLMK
ncbi:MAG: T9SS type A sorting domain-containing protein [bacterium]|nr:T9SS type A sorting domain-containing protein [bacterium]